LEIFGHILNIYVDLHSGQIYVLFQNMQLHIAAVHISNYSDTKMQNMPAVHIWGGTIEQQ
jgi:hypothetical protein